MTAIWKKFTVVCIAIAFSLSMAGCGKKSEKAADEGKPAPAAAKEGDKAKEAEKAAPAAAAATPAAK